jgi:hypothetical protein
VAEVSGQVFSEQLHDFHQVAKPEIRQMIVEEVADHEAQPAHGQVVERLTALERENSEENARLENIEKWLERIEGKLNVAIRNGGNT